MGCHDDRLCDDRLNYFQNCIQFSMVRGHLSCVLFFLAFAQSPQEYLRQKIVLCHSVILGSQLLLWKPQLSGTLPDNMKNCNSISSFTNLLKDPQFCNHRSLGFTWITFCVCVYFMLAVYWSVLLRYVCHSFFFFFLSVMFYNYVTF